MISLYALVFVVVKFLPNQFDVAVITDVSKDPYMSQTIEQCEAKKKSILALIKQKNLHAFCLEVER